MRVNWWPWRGNGDVVINNNFGSRGSNYNDYSWGCCGYRGNSWFEKMMMFSMANSFLQQTINNIFPKRAQTAQYVPPYGCTYAPTNYPGLYFQQQQSKPEGAGGAYLTPEAQDNQKMQNILQGYYKTIETLSDGTVLAVDKAGNIVKADSMNDLLEKYQALVEKAKEEKAAQEAKEAQESDVDTSGRVDNDGKVDGTVGADDDGKVGNVDDEGNVPEAKTSRKVRIPEGWYRATTDREFGDKLKEIFVTTRKSGEHAATHFANKLLEILGLNNSKNIIRELANDIAKYNPSIFDKNGNYKQGINIDEALNKLDIPDFDTLLNNYIK